MSKSFQRNGQGVLKSPETGRSLRLIALPLPAGMQGLQGLQEYTPAEQRMNESLFCC